MGENSSPYVPSTVSNRYFKAAGICAVAAIFAFAPASAQSGRVSVPKGAQGYIVDFRRGEVFNPSMPIEGMLANQRIDRTSLSILSRELNSGTVEVRESIVRLLEKIALDIDAPRADKFPVIRDHSIIRVLLVQGFAKDDTAADLAAKILLERCMPSDLAAFSDVYSTSLEQLKAEYVNLAAKAKTTSLLPLIENISKLPEWRNDSHRTSMIRIAQAALGNKRIEDEFLKSTIDAELTAPPAPTNRFYNVGSAKDGTKLAEHIHVLGLIGTTRSLLLVCGYLRSPLKSYVPEVSERSVRYASLDALLYNFPDQRILSDPIGKAGWRTAEKFCVDTLGAVFDGETPDIPADQAYPTNILPQPHGM